MAKWQRLLPDDAVHCRAGIRHREELTRMSSVASRRTGHLSPVVEGQRAARTISDAFSRELRDYPVDIPSRPPYEHLK